MRTGPQCAHQRCRPGGVAGGSVRRANLRASLPASSTSLVQTQLRGEEVCDEMGAPGGVLSGFSWDAAGLTSEAGKLELNFL